jgi:hypothetical protein
MTTDRDLDAGTKAVNFVAGQQKFTLPAGADRKIAAAVIAYVDDARRPLSVGADVLHNLLKPHLGE